MRMQLIIWLLAGFLLAGEMRAKSAAKRAEDYLNICMDLLSDFSHDDPVPEPNVECPQYRDNACCKPGYTQPFSQEEQWMNITDYTHCAVQTGKTQLSESCHDRFFDELCFTLCSPDVGPWIGVGIHDATVPDGFLELPICQSVCDDWWNACKDEYTCADDWLSGFDTSKPGHPRCSEGSVCKTFSETWSDATAFCHGIWDNSYKVVPDTQPCMQFAVGRTSGNANVAKYYAEQLVNK